MNIKWEGVMPAVTTKFTADDELDFKMFEVNVNAQLKAGVTGIILGGTLEEARHFWKEKRGNWFGRPFAW
jgi:dihydrodipicolinate synthase/N-acetylneuraminate lyase